MSVTDLAPSPQRPTPAPVERDKTVKAPRRPVPWATQVLLTLGFVIMVLPFVWMILGSFKTSGELRQWPPSWWPQDPTTTNYQDLVDQLDFKRFFFNSIVVAGLVTAGNLLFCSMLGYALAKLDFPGKKVLLGAMLATMMVPAFVTFMPLFVLVSNMNLVNSHAGLILPFLAQAFGAFLMRQFMTTIPDEVIDAARVDGAGELRIFFRVVLPLCGPALATLGVLTFLGNWNSFLWPLVVATTEEMYTLPVAIALFSTGQQRSNVGLQLGGAVIVVIPVVIVFFVMQRYIIRGIATSGLK